MSNTARSSSSSVASPMRDWRGKASSSQSITATALNSCPFARCIVPTATQPVCASLLLSALATFHASGSNGCTSAGGVLIRSDDHADPVLLDAPDNNCRKPRGHYRALRSLEHPQASKMTGMGEHGRPAALHIRTAVSRPWAECWVARRRAGSCLLISHSTVVTCNPTPSFRCRCWNVGLRPKCVVSGRTFNVSSRQNLLFARDVAA